jgi:hypothetical protein
MADNPAPFLNYSADGASPYSPARPAFRIAREKRILIRRMAEI